MARQLVRKSCFAAVWSRQSAKLIHFRGNSFTKHPLYNPNILIKHYIVLMKAFITVSQIIT
jgi:hypothetical protein